MSCYTGSNIVNDGMILNLDASNRKSWSGTGNERIGSIVPTWDVWGGLTGSAVAYNNSGGQGVFINTITSGGVNWWYSTGGQLPCISSKQYMISAKVRYSGGTPSANLFYVRQYNSSNGQTSEGGKFSSANMTPIQDGFYLAWALFTTDATAVSFYVHGYEYSGGLCIWLEDVQCKLAGLSDISGNGNHGILTGSMIRSSDKSGVIQLNGAGNSINTGLNLSSGAYTVIASARYVTVGGRVITSTTNNWLMGFWGSMTENYYSEGWVSSASDGSGDTTWRILAATGNTIIDTWQMFVNGNLTYSNSNGSQGPNGLGLNVNQGEPSNSEIGTLIAYNRALSAEEVRQNFEATKSKFL